MKPNADESPLLQFVRTYCNTSCDLSPKIIHDLLAVTHGATVSVEALRIAPLDAAVGPVRNENFAKSSIWGDSRPSPLRINLNTASVEELATPPGLSIEKCQKIVTERADHGYFRSIQELVESTELSPAEEKSLRPAERSQQNAKPDSVQ